MGALGGSSPRYVPLATDTYRGRPGGIMRLVRRVLLGALALAIEMEDRLSGTWRASDEDEELQQRFWSLYRPSELNGVFLSRIGAEFLRQNRELLD